MTYGCTLDDENRITIKCVKIKEFWLIWCICKCFQYCYTVGSFQHLSYWCSVQSIKHKCFITWIDLSVAYQTLIQHCFVNIYRFFCFFPVWRIAIVARINWDPIKFFVSSAHKQRKINKNIPWNLRFNRMFGFLQKTMEFPKVELAVFFRGYSKYHIDLIWFDLIVNSLQIFLFSTFMQWIDVLEKP